jgi:hypothetical protein
MDPVKHLLQNFKNRFSEASGNVCADIFKNFYRINPDDVGTSEVSKISLLRLKLGNDDQMMKLKSIPHRIILVLLGVQRIWLLKK